tara:strand:+ start:1771 stop:3489 length:1719 start_codon:yes stop_codon:yes gene_type:complete
MKFFIKKIYIVFFLLITLFFNFKALAKDNKIQYSGENISNYFLGIISADKNENNKALKHLEKVQLLTNRHATFNSEFIKTLVLLEKFNEAVFFSEDILKENINSFEANLLMGINYFKKRNYVEAEKYFKKLNSATYSNFFFEDFMRNVLVAWSIAAQGNQKDSIAYLEKVSTPYRHLKKIQKVFLYGYFNNVDTEFFFLDLIEDRNYDFSRYNFFLANYLISKNKNLEAKKIIKEGKKNNDSNLLIKQSDFFLSNNNEKKIKNYFNFKNPQDSLAEFFYILANLFSSEQNYQLSNFYLKISLFLNEKFLTNEALLAENYYFQNQNKISKNVYNSLKSIGHIYSWYASQNISRILSKEKGGKHSIKILEKEFNLLPNPNFEQYYEMANFYKDYEYYEQSIKYYSTALKKIKKDHYLIPKILYRRGTSYERLGDWKNGEKDLIKSLEILPDQPHVLNYLAYTWIDKGINLDRGLEMLKKATELRKDDGYIIDSLGWAYFAKKNYIEAEQFLQKAVELLPSDPVINDHYADALWMQNKNIQARYFWKYVLELDDTEEKLKDSISKKLIFGISKKM